ETRDGKVCRPEEYDPERSASHGSCSRLLLRRDVLIVVLAGGPLQRVRLGPVDKEDAVEMVDFVLDHPGFQPLHAPGNRPVSLVEASYANLVRPLYDPLKPGNGEASLFRLRLLP